jgi:DNA processing protein
MQPRALHKGSDAYPRRLARDPAAPETLWVSGPWPGGFESRSAVAVVGSRAASRRALDLSYELGQRLGAMGIDIISGGAIGVDAAAHEGALDAEGTTVAVLGTGIDIVYPERHAALFARIRQTGALVTQFAPGTTPRPGRFPMRNRVIAALADVVVIVEASLDSGSLHTAQATRLLGRTLAAVPGSAGNDQLILDGAVAVESPDDVLAVVEGRLVAPPALPEDPDALRVYQALDGTPRDVGELAFRAGLAIGTCAAMVIDLEARGLVARAPDTGGRYVRLR